MTRHTLHLTEYETTELPAGALEPVLGERLWRLFDRDGGRIRVEFPSPASDGHWRLTPAGWVGHISLTPGLAFTLQPRIPLAGLFALLNYLYDWAGLTWMPGLTSGDTLAEFAGRLADRLAEGVLERSRRGLYLAYLERRSWAPVVRGAIDLAATLSRPDPQALACRYLEQTVDHSDNQILAAALHLIAASGLAPEPAQARVRRARRALAGVTLRPVAANEAIGRSYHRLNQDYRPLHAICHFFLAHLAPQAAPGDHPTVPFLVDTPRLFERFVAAWLKEHLPGAYHLQVQEQVRPDPAGRLQFRVDMALYARPERRPLIILDTKYQVRQTTPASADVAQVIAYAQAAGCRDAVLVYPEPPLEPFDIHVGQIRVRRLSFDLGLPLEAAGKQFLSALIPPVA